MTEDELARQPSPKVSKTVPEVGPLDPGQEVPVGFEPPPMTELMVYGSRYGGGVCAFAEAKLADKKIAPRADFQTLFIMFPKAVIPITPFRSNLRFTHRF